MNAQQKTICIAPKQIVCMQQNKKYIYKFLLSTDRKSNYFVCKITLKKYFLDQFDAGPAWNTVLYTTTPTTPSDLANTARVVISRFICRKIKQH